jgi:hypothetical protein
MIRVSHVEPLRDRRLRLTLTNAQVVERHISGLMWGPVFERIAADGTAFAVVVDGGTAAWLADGADIAPETPIWNGPEPPAGSGATPPDSAVVISPHRPRHEASRSTPLGGTPWNSTAA